ncbi:hypothetical protein PITC_049350 [Penicillium italicum]|uniref:Uncharacterized protein n=1 Tax=Penicillium italicum TaxID=40296 RepID=A0A0A2K9I5_PENIT|nr:hypothetical protein PITC_049350 [Penicillium italicum]
MPPRNDADDESPSQESRHKLLAKPLHLKTLWCLQCFRTSLRDWNTDEPFEANCWIDTAASKLCRRCNATHGKCESIHRGIRGHVFELMALLEFAKTYWSNDCGGFGKGDDRDFIWDDGVVHDISDAVRDLCVAFDNLVKAHGKTHMLTGKASENAKAAYSAWCNAREHGTRSSARSRHLHAPRLSDKYASRATEHLRLRLGEESYIHWAAAICAFYDAVNAAVGIEHAIQSDHECLDIDETDGLEDFEERFPLQRPEL